MALSFWDTQIYIIFLNNKQKCKFFIIFALRLTTKIKRMKKAFLFIMVCGALLLATSCNNNSLRNKKYKSVHEEAIALALPDSEVATFPQKYKAQRAASVILVNYVEQKDSTYYLTISREDAKKLGVDGDLYDNVVKDLDNTNNAIKEINKKGEKIELLDVEKVKEDARRIRASK